MISFKDQLAHKPLIDELIAKGASPDNYDLVPATTGEHKHYSCSCGNRLTVKNTVGAHVVHSASFPEERIAIKAKLEDAMMKALQEKMPCPKCNAKDWWTNSRS